MPSGEAEAWDGEFLWALALVAWGGFSMPRPENFGKEEKIGEK